MSLYGYDRDTTPFLRSLVNEFGIYKRAYSNGPNTITSFIASFTSTYPIMFLSKDPNTGRHRYVLKYRITLPEILNKYGYETIAFNTNPYLSKYRLGLSTKFTKPFELLPGITIAGKKTHRNSLSLFISLAKPFKSFLNRLKFKNYTLYAYIRSFYHRLYGASRPYMTAEEVNNYVRKYIMSGDFSWKNKLIWIHYMDTHVPYYPYQRYLNVFNKSVSAYDALIANHYLYLKYIRSHKNIRWIDEDEIIKIITDAYDALVLYIDDQLKELFKIFEDSGMPEDTIIAIFSDHGDEHLEHGSFSHGHSLYEELVRIAFLLKDDIRKGYIDDRVQLLDFSPHILWLLGIKKPIQMMGSKLLHRNTIYMETIVPPIRRTYGDVIRGILYEKYKLIYNETRNQYELYDLEKDPKESLNIYMKELDFSSKLINELRQFIKNIKRYEVKLKLTSIF